MTLPHVAPDNRRARGDAAVHAAAPPAVRRRRTRRARHDQRQSLERADRLRGRRRRGAADRTRRRVPRRRAADRAAGRGFGGPDRAARTGHPPPQPRLRPRRRSPRCRDRSPFSRSAPISRTRSRWSSTARRSSASTSAISTSTRPPAPSRRPSPTCSRCTTVRREDLLVVHDAHPQYRSSSYAGTLGAATGGRGPAPSRPRGVGARRARRVGRARAGARASTAPATATTARSGAASSSSAASATGFERVAHLRPAALAGGDAAARHPVQAAAGFLDQARRAARPHARAVRISRPLRVGAPPAPYRDPGLHDHLGGPSLRRGRGAARLHSPGDLRGAGGDLARAARPDGGRDGALRVSVRRRRTRLASAAARRRGGPPARPGAGRDRAGVSRGRGAWTARRPPRRCAGPIGVHTVAASGGVFQNALLADEISGLLEAHGLALWINHVVPPNDGGISLGQAALGALGPCTSSR